MSLQQFNYRVPTRVQVVHILEKYDVPDPDRYCRDTLFTNAHSLPATTIVTETFKQWIQTQTGELQDDQLLVICQTISAMRTELDLAIHMTFNLCLECVFSTPSLDKQMPLSLECKDELNKLFVVVEEGVQQCLLEIITAMAYLPD